MNTEEKLNQCQKYCDENEFEKALELCNEILKTDKDNEKALGYKIHSLEFLKKDNEALKLTEHALELYPKNPHFLFSKAGILHWTLNDLDSAIEYYEKGLALVDHDEYWGQIQDIVFALEDRAKELKKSGQYQKAIRAYEKILKYHPIEVNAIDEIDTIVKEHNMTYKPCKEYIKAQELREKGRERVLKLENFLNTIEIGEYDEDYIRGCSKFKDYNSFEEYVRDVIICLMEGYPKRSEDNSRFLVKCNLDYIKTSYESGLSAGECTIEVGYCCG